VAKRSHVVSGVAQCWIWSYPTIPYQLIVASEHVSVLFGPNGRCASSIQHLHNCKLCWSLAPFALFATYLVWSSSERVVVRVRVARLHCSHPRCEILFVARARACCMLLGSLYRVHCDDEHDQHNISRDALTGCDMRMCDSVAAWCMLRIWSTRSP